MGEEGCCMTLHRRSIQGALLFTVSLGSSTALASHAATLSLSESTLNLSNFNQSPQDTASSTLANTFVEGSQANAFSTANATFFAAPPVSVSNNSASLASGQGNFYSGLGQSQAQNLGAFFVGANQSLSFNFESSLVLRAAADNPSFEGARSTGNLFFLVRDSTSQNIYGSFGAFGNVATQDNNDFLDFQIGNGVTLAGTPTAQTAFGSSQESAQASANGSFAYFFEQPTTVSLLAFTNNQADVQAVPENPNPIAFVLLGLAGIAARAWKKSRG
jgi:hypothetical protein